MLKTKAVGNKHIQFRECQKNHACCQHPIQIIRYGQEHLYNISFRSSWVRLACMHLSAFGFVLELWMLATYLDSKFEECKNKNLIIPWLTIWSTLLGTKVFKTCMGRNIQPNEAAKIFGLELQKRVLHHGFNEGIGSSSDDRNLAEIGDSLDCWIYKQYSVFFIGVDFTDSGILLAKSSVHLYLVRVSWLFLPQCGWQVWQHASFDFPDPVVPMMNAATFFFMPMHHQSIT